MFGFHERKSDSETFKELVELDEATSELSKHQKSTNRSEGLVNIYHAIGFVI